MKEVRADRREPSNISAHETNYLSIWQEVETELASEGISRQDIVRHKEDIKIYLKRMLGDSILKPPSPPYTPAVSQLESDNDNWDSISQHMAFDEGSERAECWAANAGGVKEATMVAKL